MIKGVNKQVLEIHDAQSSFFEKAIFFVKPEYSGMSEGRLRESAKRELEGTCAPPVQRKALLSDKRRAFALCLCFLAGIAVGILCSNMI